MKLAAIYNVFDGEELLEGSIRQIMHHVDKIICLVQTVSNHGNRYRGGLDKVNELSNLINEVIIYDPLDISPMRNETRKRNIGREKALSLGCTHFISMDCDEYYKPDEFKDAKDKVEELGLKSTVVRLKTYFGKPEYRIVPDETYYVPFICDVHLRIGNWSNGYECDPTRKPNAKATLLDLYMYHYSWIRDNIAMKIDNSSANVNLKKHREELINACNEPYMGMKLPFYYNHILINEENHFNIKGFL